MRHISFTGSTETARLLMADAAGTLKQLRAIGYREVETAGFGKYSAKGVLLDISPYYQSIIKGTIIVSALALDTGLTRLTRAR